MKSAIAIIILWITIVVLTATGYILNIVSLIQADSFGMLEMARAIGVIAAPLGVVLGYFF